MELFTNNNLSTFNLEKLPERSVITFISKHTAKCDERFRLWFV